MENVLISEKLHSDIMDFQLQYMYSCEAVCITRIHAEITVHTL